MPSQGRRRRKRRPDYRAPGGQASPPPPREPAGEGSGSAPAPGRRRSLRDRPPAPWGSFPLVELVVLLALALLIAGFFVQGTRGITMIAAGVGLGSLAGLELSVREHFAGYKSHSTVLAGTVAVVAAALGYFLLPDGWSPGLGLVVAVIAFAAAFYLFREAFKRRSGGLGFR